MTTTETEWDEEQQALIVALALWHDTRCRRCGGDLRETASPGMEGGYTPLPPLRCHRCTALSAVEERYRSNSHPHALMHRVIPKPGRPQAT